MTALPVSFTPTTSDPRNDLLTSEVQLTLYVTRWGTAS